MQCVAQRISWHDMVLNVCIHNACDFPVSGNGRQSHRHAQGILPVRETSRTQFGQHRTTGCVSGVNLVFATVVVAVNLLTDLSYAVIDPRVRYR